MKGRLIAATAAAALSMASSVHAEPVKTPTGVWESPGGNTRLRLYPCGANMCGKVAWASARARADAARGGHDNLIGMQLFEDFRRTGPNSFEGRVFVPDINRRFNGRLIMEDSKTITVRGCVTGTIGCRNQTWKRYSA